MKFFFFVFLVLFNLSCNKKNDHLDYKLSNKQKLVDEIRLNVSRKLKQKKGLIPFGSGGQMMHDIQMLNLGFKYYNNLNIEESRELLVSSVREFLSEINSEERIRPYLANYPFGPKNIQIEIFLATPDGSTLAPGSLVVVAATNGILKYRIDDPSGPLFKTILQETYEEAVAKLEAKNDFRVGEEKTAVDF